VLRSEGTSFLLVTGGGSTRDKPTVTFPPPMDPDIVTHELTIQVPMVGNPLLPPGARWPPARGQ